MAAEVLSGLVAAPPLSRMRPAAELDPGLTQIWKPWHRALPLQAATAACACDTHWQPCECRVPGCARHASYYYIGVAYLPEPLTSSQPVPHTLGSFGAYIQFWE